MSRLHDYHELHASLTAIVTPGSVFELRLLGQNKRRIDAGYFDCPAQAATAICALSEYYKGIYLTPNPVRPELLARSSNRIAPWAESTTMDPDIVRRKWLLIDIDPIRPTGISATAGEHEAAMRRGYRIEGMLSLMYGWCDPMVNSSGNGCHLLYPIDEENTDEVRDEISKFLKVLAVQYSDSLCNIDTSVFNAARIWRVPGTWARKGDSVTERPHRVAQIVRPITHLSRIRREQIQRFTAEHEHLLQGVKTVRLGEKKNAVEYPEDERLWKILNDTAMRRLAEWVPELFPSAREYKSGFRVSSDDLSKEYEEDLTIHPWPLGIKYFGVADQGDKTEGRRTPVSCIAEFVTEGDKDAAARRLAEVLNVAVSEFTPIPSQQFRETIKGNGLAGLLGTKPKISFKGIRNLAQLQQRQFTEQKWIIDGVLPTGNIMLASRPKMRKTWLALQLGMAIARGGKFLNWQCNKGDVLFLGLEDNERRIQNRIRTLLMFEMNQPDLAGFRYWTGGMDYDGNGQLKLSNPEEAEATLSMFPRGEAGVDALEQYLEQYPNTTTIFIDTYAHFRDTGGRNTDVYQRDYESMMPITKLAARKRVLIVPVHHEKKGLASIESGDFLEDVNGSSGITGGSDGVMSIKGKRGVQDENESRKLYISGRDVPHDFEADISFDAERGGWLIAARQDVKTVILDVLGRHPYVNQQELRALLPNVSAGRLSRCLMEMKLEQIIIQSKFGYSLRRE